MPRDVAPLVVRSPVRLLHRPAVSRGADFETAQGGVLDGRLRPTRRRGDYWVYGVLIPGLALSDTVAVGLYIFASLMALPGVVAEEITSELSPEGARRRAAARAREAAERKYEATHSRIDDGSFGGTMIERDGVRWRDSSGTLYTENFYGTFSRGD